MLEIKNLKKVHSNGFEALKSVNISIEKGELVCLLGPSGCGKTTILNLIAGLLDPTDGDILFDNESVIHKHPKDRNIGLVFQNYALYPHMTVLENVMFPLTVGNKKIKKDDATEIAKQYMKITNIEELYNKKPGEMSGGQQQRVAITRALVQNPNVLLLDEPLSNLDARLRLKIREEIRRLVKEIGITTIFVTHDQEEALSISDKIILMDNGVVMQCDKPQNLYLEPANLFVAQFMGNPIINLYEMFMKNNILVGKEFNIAIEDLLSSRLKKDLTDDKYIIGIRPEYFEVADENPDFIANIESTELIGKDCILNFSVNDSYSKAISDTAKGLYNESKVGLNIDLEKIYIFTVDGERVY